MRPISKVSRKDDERRLPHHAERLEKRELDIVVVALAEGSLLPDGIFV
jgi:hypothetical protein